MDIPELRRRLEADPSSIAFAQLAEEYRRAGQLEAAERVCRTGLDRHPSYPSARVTLGRTLIQLGKADEGQQEIERALALAPDNLVALRALGDVHRQRGERDQALEYYERAAPLARHDTELQQLVADLRRQLPAPAPPAPPADLDAVLQSMGFAGHGAPPAVEALLAVSRAGEDPEAANSHTLGAAPPQRSLGDVDRRVLRELEAWLAVLRR